MDFSSLRLCEDWIEQLTLVRCLNSIRARQITTTSQNLEVALEDIGKNLTVLDLSNLVTFRYL